MSAPIGPLDPACGAVAIAPLHTATVSGCKTVQQSTNTAVAKVLSQSIAIRHFTVTELLPLVFFLCNIVHVVAMQHTAPLLLHFTFGSPDVPVLHELQSNIKMSIISSLITSVCGSHLVRMSVSKL